MAVKSRITTVAALPPHSESVIPGLTDMHVHLMSDEDDFPGALAEDEKNYGDPWRDHYALDDVHAGAAGAAQTIGGRRNSVADNSCGQSAVHRGKSQQRLRRHY